MTRGYRDRHVRDFKKVVESFRFEKHIRDVFTMWTSIAALTIHQQPYHMGFIPFDEEFNKIETRYMEEIKGCSREELDVFAKLFAITQMALAEEKQDFLGRIYMELEISNSRNSEFFTPYEVSYLLARMNLGNVKDLIEEKGFFTLAEPASGGGGMIVAASQVVEEMGYNPREVMFFVATDVAKSAFDMTYLQTSLLGLSGIVQHGNSLHMNVWESRFTPMCRVTPRRTNMMTASLRSSKDESDQVTEVAPESQGEEARPEVETQGQLAFDFQMQRDEPKVDRARQARPKPKQIETGELPYQQRLFGK